MIYTPELLLRDVSIVSLIRITHNLCNRDIGVWYINNILLSNLKFDLYIKVIVCNLSNRTVQMRTYLRYCKCYRH